MDDWVSRGEADSCDTQIKTDTEVFRQLQGGLRGAVGGVKAFNDRSRVVCVAIFLFFLFCMYLHIFVCNCVFEKRDLSG